jgi:hypothetical protein
MLSRLSVLHVRSFSVLLKCVSMYMQALQQASFTTLTQRARDEVGMLPLTQIPVLSVPYVLGPYRDLLIHELPSYSTQH